MAATTTPDQTTTAANGVASPAVISPAAAIVPAGGGDERAISAFSNEANFNTSQRIARALASSTLVPQAYQNNLPNVLIAIELASRIGCSVFMVMQNLDIIHGRPSWRALFLIATVNASGRFTPMRFRWEGKPGTADWGCRAVAKDRDGGEECVGALITIGLANSEGWSTKSGSKWKTMPEQMLMYRAAAFWTRIFAPELSLGMQTREEIIDTTGYDVTDVPVAMTPGDVKALEAELLSDGAKAAAAPVETKPAKAKAAAAKPTAKTPRAPDAEQDGEPPETYASDDGPSGREPVED